MKAIIGFLIEETVRVGFSERMHGYLNPCEDIIQGNLPDKHNKYDENVGSSIELIWHS